MRYITGTKLQEDIYEYRRTKNGQPDPKKYSDGRRVFERAENVLKQYSAGDIDVRTKDQKIMAQYIDTFAEYEQDKLLQKLQGNASFNVKEYLADSKKTYWQKLFNFHKKKSPQVSVRDLQKRAKEYERINRKLARGWFHKEQDYQKQLILESQAQSCASDLLEDKIQLTRQNIPALKAYLQAFYGQHSPAEIDEALNKINDIETETLPEKQPTMWQRFKDSVKNKWNNLVAGTRSKPAAKIHISRKNWFQIAAASAAFVFAGLAFWKSDSAAKEISKDNTEVKAKTPAAATVAEPVATVNFADAAKELTHEQKMWKNFYETKSELHAADAKVNLQDLQKQITAQAKAGIFTMPENISVERFAYTHIMYKAYGLQSPLDAAINSQTKITTEQQRAVEEAIKIADKDGKGVRRLAAMESKRMGRKLGSYSAYDHASKQVQHNYVAAVNSVKQMNQR